MEITDLKAFTESENISHIAKNN